MRAQGEPEQTDGSVAEGGKNNEVRWRKSQGLDSVSVLLCSAGKN